VLDLVSPPYFEPKSAFPVNDLRTTSMAYTKSRIKIVNKTATDRTDSLAASPAADAATKKKRGRPKGSKNKPRKKQSSEQYEEVEQHEVVEAPAGSYNTRRARRINYARLDDPFSSE